MTGPVAEGGAGGSVGEASEGPRVGGPGPDGTGRLSVVGTPIGNLEDASPRVLRTLAEADLLLCEDTRVTSRLLARFDIHVPLGRADANTLDSRIDPTLDAISSGKKVAFVSDAGMPGVSDPGQRLVDAALDAGLPVEVIPGPSAVVCALVASGLPMDHFFFEGFLPRKRGAQLARLAVLAQVPGALVLYESPRRVAATLAVVAEAFPHRQVALVRELTKVHEETVRALAPDLARQVAERPEVRGECVVVIAGPSAEELAQASASAREADLPLEEAIRQGLEGGEVKSALAKRLARSYGLPRAQVYDLVVAAASAG